MRRPNLESLPPAVKEYEECLREARKLFNECADEISEKSLRLKALKRQQRQAMLDAKERLYKLAESGGLLSRNLTARAQIAGDRERLKYQEDIDVLQAELNRLRDRRQEARSMTFNIQESMKLLREEWQQGGGE
jgi:predicted  nucleic acid-binding Zn-ribbon protein